MFLWTGIIRYIVATISQIVYLKLCGFITKWHWVQLLSQTQRKDWVLEEWQSHLHKSAAHMWFCGGGEKKLKQHDGSLQAGGPPPTTEWFFSFIWIPVEVKTTWVFWLKSFWVATCKYPTSSNLTSVYAGPWGSVYPLPAKVSQC